MGAIVGVTSKKGENVVPSVITALSALMHRGTDAYGIGTHKAIQINTSLETLSEDKFSSTVALGHNLSRTFLRDQPQPVLGEGFSFVFEGRLFPPSYSPEVEEVLKILRVDARACAEQIIKKLNGSYVFAVACPNSLLVGRDMMGTAPLYYGENETISAIASERKALWKLNITNPKSFPPGNIAEMSLRGFSFRAKRTIVQPPAKPIGLELATGKLQNLLSEAVRKQVLDVEEVTVAFSGGLDSSVIAKLVKTCGKKVTLITVSIGSQPEAHNAKIAAKELGLPLYIKTYTPKDVEQVLPKVVWLIEEQDIIKVSVAIPFYWIAETSSKLGNNILLAGQGADELFGGYQKYIRVYAKSGVWAVQDALFHDAAFSYEQNLQRDNQVCASHKVELRLPFLDPAVVDFALSMPLDLKIESPKDQIRKKVLRHTAQNLCISPAIAYRNKKAIQYTTGVCKALQKLARNNNLTVKEYIAKVFWKVYPSLSR